MKAMVKALLSSRSKMERALESSMTSFKLEWGASS